MGSFSESFSPRLVHSDGAEMPSLCLSILPDRLRLAKLSLDGARFHAAALMRLLIIDGPQRDRFFAYVETPHEVSLFMDDHDAEVTHQDFNLLHCRTDLFPCPRNSCPTQDLSNLILACGGLLE